NLRALALWCAVAWVSVVVAVQVAQAKEQDISEKQAAAYLIEQQHEAGIYADFEGLSSLAFYMPEPMVLIETVSNDLLYGRKRGEGRDLFVEPGQWFAKKDARVIIRNAYLPNFERNFPGWFCVEKSFGMITILQRCSSPVPALSRQSGH